MKTNKFFIMLLTFAAVATGRVWADNPIITFKDKATSANYYNATSGGYYLAGWGTMYKQASGGQMDDGNSSCEENKGLKTSGSTIIFSPAIVITGIKVVSNGDNNRSVSEVKKGNTLNSISTTLTLINNPMWSRSDCIPKEILFENTINAEEFVSIKFSGNMGIVSIELIPPPPPTLNASPKAISLTTPVDLTIDDASKRTVTVTGDHLIENVSLSITPDENGGGKFTIAGGTSSLTQSEGSVNAPVELEVNVDIEGTYSDTLVISSSELTVKVPLDLTVTPADETPPVVATYFPVENATDVPLINEVYVIFNEDVVRGAGDVTINNGITVNSALVVDDNKLVITTTESLVKATNYTVTLAEDVVKDLSNNSNVQVSWSFATDGIPPTIISKEPENPEGEGDAPIKPIKITFSEDVKIVNATKILVGDEAAVDPSVTGNVLTLKNAIAPETGYTVQLEVGAITDMAGNEFAGVTWTFTTTDDHIEFPYHPTFDINYQPPSWMYGTINYRPEDASCTSIPAGGYVLSVQDPNQKDTLFIDLPKCGTFTAKVAYTGSSSRSLRLFRLGDDDFVASVTPSNSNDCHTLTYNFNTFEPLTLYITNTGNGGRIWDLEITAPVATAPEVTSVSPADNAENVLLDAPLYVVYDQAIEIANADGVSINDVPATITASNDTLYITPASPLINDVAYTVSVTEGTVREVHTHTEANAVHSWNFTTVKPAPTKVEITHNASGTDTLRLGATWQLSADVTPSNALSTALTWSVVSGDVQVTESGLLSTTGSAVGAAQVAVAVAGYPEITDSLDVTLIAVPTQVTLAPPAQATAVAVAAPVYVAYSHPIQLLTSAGITIDKDISATLSVNGDTLFITPSTALSNETKYTVTVPANAVADAAYPNLVVAELLSWSFTTAAAGYIAPDSVVISGGNSAVRPGEPLLLIAAVWKGGYTITEDDEDYEVTWSVAAGDERVEVSDNGLVSVKPEATVGAATIRATVKASTAYSADKEISVEITPDTVADAFVPAHGAADVAPDAVISVTFNQSVEVANATLITVNGNPVQSAAAAGSVVTITAALLNDLDYTVAVGVGAIQAATSSLTNTNEYAWTFHTVQPTPAEVKISGLAKLAEGESTTLTAEVLPANAIAKEVTWSVKSGTAVTIDASGNVKAVSSGTATVQATVNGYESVYGTLDVLVTKALLSPPDGTYFVFHETFDNAVEGSLLGAADGTDETGYVIGANDGTTISSGVLTMLGTRWKTKNMDLTGEDVTLLVKVRQNVAIPASGKRFQLALDTAGSSGVSNLGNYTIVSALPASSAPFLILNRPITSGTTSSFIHFRTESESSVDIEEIAIYKKGEAPVVVEPSGVAIAHNASGTDTLRLGATWQLSATVTPGNATSTDLTWSVVSGDVEITAGGLLSATGSAVGSARVAVAVTGYPNITDFLDVTLVAVPAQVKLAPPAQATAVPVAAPVYATYSHPIQLLTDAGITVSGGVDANVAVTVSANGDTLFITPSAALDNATAYTVTVPAGAVADAAYPNLAATDPLSWTFTTAALGYVAPDSVVIGGGSTVSPDEPLQLSAAVWKQGAPITSNDPDYAVAWSVAEGSDKVEVSADGLVSVKQGATAGAAAIRATVSAATAYYADKQIAVEAILAPVATAPEVASVSPADNAENVPLDAPLYAVYDQAIEVANAGGVSVNGAAAAITASNDTLYITSAAPLANDVTYTVSVAAGAVREVITHTEANAAHSWSFTTVAPDPIAPPAPTGVAIAHNASGTDTLRLGATWQLSAAVTPSNAASTALTWSVVSGNVEITAGGLLSATGSAVGAARVAVAVTGYPDVTDFLDVTLVAVPEQVKLAPPAQATAVPVAAPVYATYSHPIQLLTDAGITVSSGVDANVAVTVSANGDTLFITPSAALNSSTAYTVTVPAGAVADAAYSNLAVAEPLSWSFTTAEQPGGGEQPPTSVSAETFGLKLYPNPVRTALNISLTSEIARVELVSQTGSKVLSRSVQGTTAYTLNLQGVAAGSYVMAITLKNGAVVTQIIVKQE
ncbi:MAG: Ig-like domain-containing protein [Prevotellaceae bacterium]|jgi:uncharacterized protein YjdB|nr:Ig-like domain-containing protein [Prevotellaceae bacterium]